MATDDDETMRNSVQWGRAIRNAAITTAGIYFFSRLGGAEAAPVTDEEALLADQRKKETIALGGEIYDLYTSSFDNAISESEHYALLSKLSLGISGLSLFTGILYYAKCAYAQQRRQAVGPEVFELQRLDIAPSAERDLEDIEQQRLTPAAPITAGSAANFAPSQPERDTPQRSWLSAMQATCQNALGEVSYVPGFLALFGLFSGVGGYVYADQRRSNCREQASILARRAAITNPIIDITPALLEKFTAEPYNGDETIRLVTADEIALLAGGRNSAIMTERRLSKAAQHMPDNQSEQLTQEQMSSLKRAHKVSRHLPSAASTSAVSGSRFVTERLAKKVAQCWRNSDAEQFTQQQINSFREAPEQGLYYFDQMQLININGYYWLFTSPSNSTQYGVLINKAKKEEIKIAKDKDNKWTIKQLAEVVERGDQLLAEIIKLSDYSQKVQLLIGQEIANIIYDKKHIQFNQFKKLLATALLLVFVRNSSHVSVGLEILQAISEINGSRNLKVDKNNIALLTMMSNEAAPLDIYSRLFDEEVSDPMLYDSALIETLDGFGKRREVEGLIDNGVKCTTIISDFIDDKIEKLNRESGHDEVIIKAERLKQNIDYFTESIKLIRMEFPEHKDFITLEEDYKRGIKLVKTNMPDPPLTFEKYNRLYFNLIKEEFADDENFGENKDRTQMYRAARTYLTSVYASNRLLRQILEYIPENITNITLASGLTLQRFNDYRDILLAEEAAETFYEEKKVFLDNLMSNQDTDEGFSDAEPLIVAIFFSIIRGLSKYRITVASVDGILKYYYDRKHIEYPIETLLSPPKGYYSLKDFKKRGKFDTQTKYYDQYNHYIKKYMDYDIDSHMQYILMSEQVPLYFMLFPAKIWYEYEFLQELTNNRKEKVWPESRGKFTVMQLSNGNWFLLTAIDGQIKGRYLKSHQINDNFYNIFLEPNKHFGSNQVFMRTALRILSLQEVDNVYPSYADSNAELLEDYRIAWEANFGYSFYHPPVFRWEKKQVNGKRALDCCRELVRNYYVQVVKQRKQGMDEQGFWHQLATTTIPFYGVIYEAVTDSEYEFTPEDAFYVVMDSLAVIGFLMSIAIKVGQLARTTVVQIARRHSLYIASGLSRQDALRRVLRELPYFISRLKNPLFSRAVRRDFFQLFIPFPIDLRHAVRNIYQTATKTARGATNGVRKGLSKLPTKVNPAWKVTKKETIEQLTRNPESMLYEAGSEKYVKLHNDYYPVVADASNQNWYVTQYPTMAGQRLLRPIYRVDDQWTVSPVYEGRFIDPANYAGAYTTNAFPFGPVTKFLVSRARIMYRVKQFVPATNQYTVNRSFTVVPIGLNNPQIKSFELARPIAIRALEQAVNDGRAFAQAAAGLTEEQKAAPQVSRDLAAIRVSTKLFEDSLGALAGPVNPYDTFFALVNTTGNWQTDPNAVYAVSHLRLEPNTGTLGVVSVAAHPKVIAAKNATLQAWVGDQQEINKYKIKEVAMHLATSSIRQACDHHASIVGNHNNPAASSIKYIAATTVNPVTEAMVARLRSIYAYTEQPFALVSQRIRSTLTRLNHFASNVRVELPFIPRPAVEGAAEVAMADVALAAIVGPSTGPVASISGAIHDFSREYREAAARIYAAVSAQQIPVEEPGVINRLNFHVLQPVRYTRREWITEMAHLELRKNQFNIVTENVGNVLTTTEQKYRQFADQVQVATNELIDTLFEVQGTLQRMKSALASSSVARAELNSYLTDVFKLDLRGNLMGEQPAALPTKEEILVKIVDRLEEIVKLNWAFLQKVRANGFRNFAVIDAIPDSAIGAYNVAEAHGFVIKGDPDERIYLTYQNVEADRTILKYSILHETSHVSADADDFSYFNSVRVLKKKNLSDINVLDPTMLPVSANDRRRLECFILNYSQFAHFSRERGDEAIRMFQNDKLVRSDVLLHTAEFDAMLIKEFHEKFCTEQPLNSATRSRRETPARQKLTLSDVILALATQTVLRGRDEDALAPDMVLSEDGEEAWDLSEQ